MKKLYAVAQSKTGLWEVVEVDDTLRPPRGASKVYDYYWAWTEECRRNSPRTEDVSARKFDMSGYLRDQVLHEMVNVLVEDGPLRTRLAGVAVYLGPCQRVTRVEVGGL